MFPPSVGSLWPCWSALLAVMHSGPLWLSAECLWLAFKKPALNFVVLCFYFTNFTVSPKNCCCMLWYVVVLLTSSFFWFYHAIPVVFDVDMLRIPQPSLFRPETKRPVFFWCLRCQLEWNSSIIINCWPQGWQNKIHETITCKTSMWDVNI